MPLLLTGENQKENILTVPTDIYNFTGDQQPLLATNVSAVPTAHVQRTIADGNQLLALPLSPAPTVEDQLTRKNILPNVYHATTLPTRVRSVPEPAGSKVFDSLLRSHQD